MTDAWASKRLIYRAVEKGDHDALLKTLDSDSESFINISSALPAPLGKKDMEEYYEYLQKKLLAVAICLPAPPVSNTQDGGTPPQPIPIGVISLEEIPARHHQHRGSEIAVNVVKEYRGQGYGTEAIEWALEWGFEYAGLHRIGIVAFAYNAGAVRLYERMGFAREGVKRDCIYSKGRFWDVVLLSMLEEEWRARGGK